MCIGLAFRQKSCGYVIRCDLAPASTWAISKRSIATWSRHEVIEELQQVGWLQRALELPRAKARLSHSRFIYVSLKKIAPCASRTRSDMSQSIIALLGSRLDDSERTHYSIIALRSESERRAMLFLDSAAAYK